MTTAPEDRSPHPRPARHPAPPPVARLAIAPHGEVTRRLDGAWWPHSTDLVAELPDLLAALPFDWPRITHATVNGSGWPALPGHILVAGHVVRLRRTTNRPGPDTLCLVSAGVGRWDLLILPPATPEPDAVRTMAEMARTGTPTPA
ncbi:MULTISPECIES: DUF5994 family protein [unclassified Streptomyces]|uniref:DUF5994 family protein n=1 Tax=unclassified Streptomyces TaxID=2593676 RepID=UPI0003817896|nr:MULTISPECIES: DUF5994 family protein [unclassified Streptomyces]MYT32818.1 hypothetical protein [Streptomyces sp. SID8354]